METRILATRNIALLEEELRSRGITEGFLDITYREIHIVEGKRKLYAIVPVLIFAGSGEELLYIRLLDRQ